MIIENGTIELSKLQTSNSFDDDGYPIAEANMWGDPIPCQYRFNKYDNMGKSNGEAFTIANYEILIEETIIDTERLRLRDKMGHHVGEFSIISVEPLDAVCEVRILV